MATIGKHASGALRFLLLITVALGACREPPSTPDPPSISTIESDLDFLAKTDGETEIAVAGSEFQVETNNCGSRAAALESFTRSREFVVILDAAISESLRGQVGGSVLVADAEIEAAVEASLGVQVGSRETVQTQRQIETPADTRTIVTLQWEEMWDTGTVSIERKNGESIGNVPFRVLTTLRLTQKEIVETPCNSPNLLPTPTPTLTADQVGIIGNWNCVECLPIGSDNMSSTFTTIQFFGDGLYTACVNVVLDFGLRQEEQICGSGRYDFIENETMIRLTATTDQGQINISAFDFTLEGDVLTLYYPAEEWTGIFHRG